MIKVVSKGYTITVKSWENDGDYSNVMSMTVQTLEEAKVWWKMMQLCKSGKGGLGNSCGGFNSAQRELATSFIKENYKVIIPNLNIEEYEDIDEDIDDDDYDDYDGLSSVFIELAGKLLGYSEFYTCRVAQSCVITYSPEDIFVEEIKI